MNTDVIKKYLGGKRFWRQTLTLALPIAFQNLLTSSFVLVDTLMVGQLGDVALSAVGMAGQWSWLLNMLIIGICSGSAVFVSQYWGIKDTKGIHKITGLAVTVGLIFTSIFFFSGLFASEFIVGLFNKDAAVIENGSAYLKIACFSYPGTVLGALLGAILRSSENVKLPVFSALFTTILNAVLDYCLIFGVFGLPPMGIEGAALATCISAWAGPVLILAVSIAERNILFAPICEIFSFNKELSIEFLKKASPVVFNEGLWSLGTFLYNMVFANMGYENFAAVTILKTIENISFVFLIGLCNACCVILGMSVGSGRIKDAVSDSKRFALLIPGVAVVVGVILLIFRSNIIGLFNLGGKLTPFTINTAMIISMIYAIELPLRSVPYAFIVGIFRSGGDTVMGTKIDLIGTWIVAVPLVVILAYVVKAPFLAVFAAMYMGEDYIKTFLCIKHYLSYKWFKPVTKEGQAELLKFLQKKNK